MVTTQFTFDIAGFDDYNGIPSSQLEKVTERYWRDGEELRMTLTVEDPLFLREPASYTTPHAGSRPPKATGSIRTNVMPKRRVAR